MVGPPNNTAERVCQEAEDLPPSRLRQALYGSLIVVSLIVGLSVPAFYDWTGADQSKPPDRGYGVLIGLAVCAGVVCLVLPWLPLPAVPELRHGRIGRPQFSLRAIMIATTLLAISLAGAVAVKGGALVLCGGLFGLSIAYAAWLAIPSKSARLPLITWAACTCLPFIWLVTWRQSSLRWWTFALCPNGLSSVIAGYLWGVHPTDLAWVSLLAASLELWIAIGMMRSGPKWTLAYFVILLVYMSVGSLGLNAVVRM